MTNNIYILGGECVKSLVETVKICNDIADVISFLQPESMVKKNQQMPQFR